jgi:hypothetical protein
MDVVEVADGRAVIALHATEIVAIMNSMNEALEAVEDWEFSTRLGVEKDFVRSLRAGFDQALSELDG